MHGESFILNDEHDNGKVSGVRFQVSGFRFQENPGEIKIDFDFPET